MNNTMLLNSKRLLLTCAVAGGICGLATAADKEEKKITFDDHIKPIFREHCTTCHSESDKESDLALDSYAATLIGGSSGEVIKSGDSGGSRLYALVTHAEGPFMPPDEDPMSKEKLDLIKTWIDQGMPENSGSKIRRASSAATAMLTTATVGRPAGPPPMPEKLLMQPILEPDRSAAISALAASPWAPLIAVGGQEQVVLYHAENRGLLGIIPFPEGEPQSITFTRDGKQILIGGGRHSHSGCAVLVDVATGERIAKVGDELDTVLAADISPDKRHIALAGPQKIVRVFDTVTGDLVHSLKKHTDWIFTLRYSPDGILLASGDRSNGLVLWEAESGLLYGELKGHRGAVRSVDFRADSNVLVSASMDGTLKTWDMFESKQIKSWNAHGGGATAVAYTNDGDIASAGRDRKLKYWDTNGKLKSEFGGLSEAGLEVAATGDGKVLAGGDWNGQVLVWQASQPKQPQPLEANPPGIEKRLAVASANQEKLAAELAEAERVWKQATIAREQLAKENTALAAEQAEGQSRLTQLSTSTINLEKEQSATREQIAALEQQLAQLRKRDTELEKQIATSKSEQQRLVQSTEATAKKLAALKPKLEEQAAAAKAVEEAASQARSALAAAQAEVDRITAAKVALETRAKELAAAAESAQAKLDATNQQLEQQRTQSQRKAEEAAKLQQQVDALASQLAKLNEQLAAAKAAHGAAKSTAGSTQQAVAKLKEQLQTAEQEALQAAEALKLFQSAYDR